MNFHFPDLRLLCMAENATHNLHNVVTLRGAQVRDAWAWSRLPRRVDRAVRRRHRPVFASHHWPTLGRRPGACIHLSNQRDLYGYLHDQTLRLMNHGLTGPEIAEEVELPPGLDQSWDCRGYYGSVSHNVKAIYQRYMGWFDGNPANLWRHPPRAARHRATSSSWAAPRPCSTRAQRSFDDGDYRWVAEVVNHVVFADPTNPEARELQARTPTSSSATAPRTPRGGTST